MILIKISIISNRSFLTYQNGKSCIKSEVHIQCMNMYICTVPYAYISTKWPTNLRRGMPIFKSKSFSSNNNEIVKMHSFIIFCYPKTLHFLQWLTYLNAVMCKSVIERNFFNFSKCFLWTLSMKSSWKHRTWQHMECRSSWIRSGSDLSSTASSVTLHPWDGGCWITGKRKSIFAKSDHANIKLIIFMDHDSSIGAFMDYHHWRN